MTSVSVAADLFTPCATCSHLGWSHDNWEVCAECGCENWTRPSPADPPTTPVPVADIPPGGGRPDDDWECEPGTHLRNNPEATTCFYCGTPLDEPVAAGDANREAGR